MIYRKSTTWRQLQFLHHRFASLGASPHLPHNHLSDWIPQKPILKNTKKPTFKVLLKPSGEGENEFRMTCRPMDPQEEHMMTVWITPDQPKEEVKILTSRDFCDNLTHNGSSEFSTKLNACLESMASQIQMLIIPWAQLLPFPFLFAKFLFCQQALWIGHHLPVLTYNI